MSKVAGYFLILNESRYFSFQGNIYDKFAEPVPEFSHPRHENVAYVQEQTYEDLI